MSTTNRKLGNDFEREFCQMLFDNGFWCHNMAQKSEGQPADIIAAKNGKAYLIDCKVCSNHSFALTRVEPNQISAMQLFEETNGTDGLFAIKIDQLIYMVPYTTVRNYLAFKGSMNIYDVMEAGESFVEWLGET